MKNKKKDKIEDSLVMEPEDSDVLDEEIEDVEIEKEEIEEDTFGLHLAEFASEVKVKEIEADPRTTNVRLTTANLPDPVYIEKQTKREREIYIKKLKERDRW